MTGVLVVSGGGGGGGGALGVSLRVLARRGSAIVNV